MNREALVFALSGVFFGVLIGWIIGTQQGTGRTVPPVPQQEASGSAAPVSGAEAPPRLDESHVRELRARAEQNAGDADVRTQLGNVYFDAGRFSEAIEWYEKALKLNPRDPNVSTDLGVSYYYTNQPDRALEQFEHSLSVDPKHTKTMLNIGIVRAYGKQDLAGAAKAWEELVRIAPDSPEGRAARQALDNMRAAHPSPAGPAVPPSGGK